MSFYGESTGQLVIETDSVLKMQMGDTTCYIFSIKPQHARTAIFTKPDFTGRRKELEGLLSHLLPR